MDWRRVQARFRESNRAGSIRESSWGRSLPRRRACGAERRRRPSPRARPGRHRPRSAGRGGCRGAELWHRPATGLYELVADPGEADLVMELQLTAPSGPAWDKQVNKVNGATEPLPMLRLVIYDR